MKQIIEAVGLTGMGMSFVVLFIIFMAAYSHPEKTVCVELDRKGEADIEFVFLIALLPIVVYTFINCLKGI